MGEKVDGGDRFGRPMVGRLSIFYYVTHAYESLIWRIKAIGPYRCTDSHVKYVHFIFSSKRNKNWMYITRNLGILFLFLFTMEDSFLVHYGKHVFGKKKRAYTIVCYSMQTGITAKRIPDVTPAVSPFTRLWTFCKIMCIAATRSCSNSP